MKAAVMVGKKRVFRFDFSTMNKRPAAIRKLTGEETSLLVVGIGASAGGLSALKAFFSAIDETHLRGVAYVLVQHLAPDHESLLPAILQHHTTMMVLEARNGLPILENHVYVAPPGKDLAILEGIIRLSEPTSGPGPHHSIDFWFESLAREQGESAIAIILSGSGCDGTAGASEIKVWGGTVLVQSPETAEFDSMPRSVVEAGWADRVMPPGEMPALLADLAGKLAGRDERQVHSSITSLLHWLQLGTGHDFSNYKRNTITRAIRRGMALQQIASIPDYQIFLENNPAEVDLLLRRFLIGVTRFFRDPECFESLQKLLIAKLSTKQGAGETVRAWVAGCSTGEEAYSIAILLAEAIESSRPDFKVQVFASDIDSRAVATARTGVYPESIADHVTPSRLSRYFTRLPGGGGYMINKFIRDSMVFSTQNVIKDPPFSKLDLIVCRNLLIYFNAPLQKRLLPVFHQALKPSGLLFLGSAESISLQVDLFAELDRKSKIYVRRDNHHAMKHHAFTRIETKPLETPTVRPTASPVEKTSFRELTEQALLDRIFMAALLVNSEGDVFYQHGRAGMFLEPSPGAAGVPNILKMARKGLRASLSSSLRMAAVEGQTTGAAGIEVKTNGHFTPVNLAVCPVAGCPPAERLFLVILEDAGEDRVGLSPTVSAQFAQTDTEVDTPFAIASLREELREQQEYSREMLVRLECANEEKMCSLEEMQAINEELQSTNEELETSREEVQSINEELASTNVELQTKFEELVTTNTDLNNLLECTGVGTLFVDLELKIRRFNPDVSKILNLIPGDLGRPMGHITSNLATSGDLTAGVRSVLATQTTTLTEVATVDGEHFLMRISPYSSSKGKPEGAVISFANITEIVRARAVLKKAHDLHRSANAVRDSRDAIIVRALDGRILAWNPAATSDYGWTEAEALNLNIGTMIPGGEPETETELKLLLESAQTGTLQACPGNRITKGGSRIEISMIPTLLLNKERNPYAITTIERPVTKGTQ